jgi:serine acetyltransferase
MWYPSVGCSDQYAVVKASDIGNRNEACADQTHIFYSQCNVICSVSIEIQIAGNIGLKIAFDHSITLVIRMLSELLPA